MFATSRCLPGKEAQGSMESDGRKRDGRSGTILLVDDSDIVRNVIARMLEASGFTVLKASGGEEALSISGNTEVPIDLLLSDMVMPGMGGLELADRIAHVRPDLRILFMTGYAEDIVTRDGILGENREWIGKPFTQEEIRDRVAAILTR